MAASTFKHSDSNISNIHSCSSITFNIHYHQ